MTYLRRTPGPPLSLVVDHLWVFEDQSVGVPGGLLFADGCADLMFNLTDALTVTRGSATSRWSDVWVSGQRLLPIDIGLSKCRFTIVGARLRPVGLSALIGVPAVELTDEVVDLREFWRGFAAEVYERLAGARTATDRLDELERALAVRLLMHGPPHAGMSVMADAIRSVPGHQSVSGLARDAGVSHKHLTRLFRAHLGIKPKAYQRVCRFRSLLRSLAGVRRPDWARLALQCGYSDQAHLCREFREFTGLTPTAYRSEMPAPDYLPWGGLRFGAVAGDPIDF